MAEPILKFFTVDGATISGLAFGTLNAGDESTVTPVLLFNNKGGPVEVDEAVDIRITVLDENGEKNSRAIKEGFVLARSAGVTNPNSIGDFFDDNQVIFTPLSDVNDLFIGNIPSGAGRAIFFKIRVPTDAVVSGLTIQFIAGHGGNVTSLPFFFDRAFGDGVVQEELKQVFPAVIVTQISTYSILPFLSGAYTGNENKDYIVKIVTAGTPGVAEYQVSDDNEVSFSSTLLAATSGFTDLLTSNDVDEGVDILWSNEIRLEVNDKYRVPVETRPFQFKAGQTNSLEGFIGAGTALIANNRVRQTTPNIQQLIASTQTFIFLGVDGNFTASINDPAPQVGKLLMGWFKTDTFGIIDSEELFPFVTLGLDLLDDFTPQFDQIVGLSWAFFQGRFRRFDEVIRIPPQALVGFVTLLPGLTNFVQVDPIAEEVITSSFGFLPDHIPLFRVGTGPQFIESFIDERAEVGVSVLTQAATFTTSETAAGLTATFDFTGFANRAVVRKTTITPSAAGVGFTVTFYERDTKLDADIEYLAGNLPNPFTDEFLFFHHDRDNTKELHGRISNPSALTQTFTIDLIFDRLA